MPLKPSDLVAKGGKRLVLEMDEAGNFALTDDPKTDATVEIHYRITAWLADEQQAVADRIRSGDGDWVFDVAARRIVSWDMVTEDGKPMPLEAEYLKANVSPDFLLDVIGAMNEDSGLGKVLKTLSSNGAASPTG